MRAINIFKLPLNNDTKEYFQKCILSSDSDLDINIALDECLCENTQYAYVGLYKMNIIFAGLTMIFHYQIS